MKKPIQRVPTEIKNVKKIPPAGGYAKTQRAPTPPKKKGY